MPKRWALKIASFIGTSLGNTERAMSVESSKSGTQTVIAHSVGQFNFLYITEPSSSWEDRTSPPTIAGVILSGWPSISQAIDNKATSSAGLPNSSFAAINAPTITEALLPKPLATGIFEWMFIFSSLGVCPIELYRSSTAL